MTPAAICSNGAARDFQRVVKIMRSNSNIELEIRSSNGRKGGGFIMAASENGIEADHITGNGYL